MWLRIPAACLCECECICHPCQHMYMSECLRSKFVHEFPDFHSSVHLWVALPAFLCLSICEWVCLPIQLSLCQSANHASVCLHV